MRKHRWIDPHSLARAHSFSFLCFLFVCMWVGGFWIFSHSISSSSSIDRCVIMSKGMRIESFIVESYQEMRNQKERKKAILCILVLLMLVGLFPISWLLLLCSALSLVRSVCCHNQCILPILPVRMETLELDSKSRHSFASDMRMLCHSAS